MFKIKTATSLALILSASVAMAGTQSDSSFLDSRGLFVNGMTPAQITLNDHTTKTIRLMNISLSPRAQAVLANKASYLLTHPSSKMMSARLGLPEAKENGMNNEPVLDQGQWGTCATFATTGAINALYGLTDDNMVSQLCNLELGRTLNSPEAGDGGWDGSFGYAVFGQINQYGYINKGYEHSTGCGGLKEYPAYSSSNGSAMPADDFTANSLKTFTENDWKPLIAYNGNFSPLDPQAAETALDNVKKALVNGNRVVFGTLIDGNVGQVGAAGSYHNAFNDAWVMTPQIQKDLASNSVNEGHEIIITGYDDNACALYFDNWAPKQQCGLLRIRNSWGSGAGDQGDYYMSYDFFKGMAIEAYAIGSNAKNS